MLSPVSPTVLCPHRVVNESMERVEQDRVAMAAARMRQVASGGGGVAVALLAPLEEAEEGPRESSPDPAQVGVITLCVCVCLSYISLSLCVPVLCMCVASHQCDKNFAENHQISLKFAELPGNTGKLTYFWPKSLKFAIPWSSPSDMMSVDSNSGLELCCIDLWLYLFMM